jgi:hypothetical protein
MVDAPVPFYDIFEAPEQMNFIIARNNKLLSTYFILNTTSISLSS